MGIQSLRNSNVRTFQKSSNTLSGNLPPYPVKATGGTVTFVGPYTVHTFTASANFVVSQSLTNVEYLVIAGGGGGGDNCGSGGGAGGYRNSVPGEISGGSTAAESRISLSPNTYPVTVGAGGPGNGGDIVGNGRPRGADGFASSFSTISSTGGGGGAAGGFGQSPGRNGASGGGASGYQGTYSGGSGISGQGYRGGDGIGSSTFGCGGGGGAGGKGLWGVSTGRNGGPGLLSSIDGTSVVRASGGSSCGSSGRTIGGGGSGDGVTPLAAYQNTGGGGGQASNGGSGIVIIRYLTV
jgi:hypothetical protein